MTRDAQRAAGAIPTAEPWRALARKATPTPPLRIGIVVDTSGSMCDFTAPVASIAWILARAAALSGTDAATATVHFDGATVAAITRPGHNPAQVPVFDTGGGGHPVGTRDRRRRRRPRTHQTRRGPPTGDRLRRRVQQRRAGRRP